MKPIILLLAFTLLSVTGFAQYQYHPIPMDSATWNYTAYYYPGYRYPISKYSYHLILKGDDTVVNNINYYKVYLRSSGVQYRSTPKPTPNVASNPDFCIGGIREDTSNRIVYFISFSSGYASKHTDTTERVIYDFNQQIGDTLHINGQDTAIYYPTRDAIYVIKDIDTVTIGNKTRKRFHAYATNSTNHPNDSVMVTEGIGSSTGLLWYIYVFGGSHYFTCHAAPNFVYINPYNLDTSPCKYTHEYSTPTGINKTDKTQPIKVYPNPTNNTIHIEAPDLATITLYNTIGQVAYHTTQGSTINIGHLPAGTYILMLRDKDKNTIHKELLIKQ